MSRHSTDLLKAALSALHYSGADALGARFLSAGGVILMLHQVTPEPVRAFEPNGLLKITPDFLKTAVDAVRAAGFEIVALDDVKARLENDKPGKPFAVFTLDDGYKDNRDFAYPIFKSAGVPFTIYVPSNFGDGKGDLWWLSLEEALRRLTSVEIDRDGEQRSYSLQNADEKSWAFEDIYWWLRTLPEARVREIVRGLVAKADLPPFALCQQLVMSWDEIRALAQDPLVTIGAHTVGHYALAKLPEDDARREMVESVKRVAQELGKPCRHFSYPYGDETSAGVREFDMARELGIETAVTTRKGLLDRSSAGNLTALPRLSLNGNFQEVRYLRALLSGVPFALRDGVKRALGSVTRAKRVG